MTTRKWLTPFMKQCFVTAGVTLNMSGQGTTMSFAGVLLPQLREPGSSISIDDSSGSLIAAFVGISLFMGALAIIPVMTKYGRKPASLLSVTPMIIGWFCIFIANNIPILLIARFLQGLSMGMSGSLGPIIIGECTSPENRGVHLITISLAIAAGILLVHAMGPFLRWKTIALVLMGLALVDFLIIVCCPESPSWLAGEGKHEACKKSFRWLRGDTEEEELNKMIEASDATRAAASIDAAAPLKTRIKKKFVYLKNTMKKKRFYKPIFTMIHVYALAQWCSRYIFVSYISDMMIILGIKSYVVFFVLSLDVLRIIATFCAMFAITILKRRTLLFVTGSLNIFSMLATAAYEYTINHHLLPIEHHAFGFALSYLLMFSFSAGFLPLSNVVAGELFPLEYRSLSGGISVIFFSANLFICVKTVPFLFNNIGLNGTYCLYSAIIFYCLVIVYIFLPETKDMTLLEIEHELRSKSSRLLLRQPSQIR